MVSCQLCCWKNSSLPKIKTECNRKQVLEELEGLFKIVAFRHTWCVDGFQTEVCTTSSKILYRSILQRNWDNPHLPIKKACNSMNSKVKQYLNSTPYSWERKKERLNQFSTLCVIFNPKMFLIFNPKKIFFCGLPPANDLFMLFKTCQISGNVVQTMKANKLDVILMSAAMYIVLMPTTKRALIEQTWPSNTNTPEGATTLPTGNVSE